MALLDQYGIRRVADMMNTLPKILLNLWRSLNGDAAYERYLAHWHTHLHRPEEQPLDRKAFFAAETQRKWSGVKRCC